MDSGHRSRGALRPCPAVRLSAVGRCHLLLARRGDRVLSRRFGFGADHVRTIEVVTADGELRRVTAEDSPDLFWAMRGAGSNFGVVTSIEVDLVAVPELYAGGLFFSGDQRADVLAAFVQCASTVPDATQPLRGGLHLPRPPRPSRGGAGPPLLPRPGHLSGTGRRG